MFVFKWFLKTERDEACLISSKRDFQARTGDGKKERWEERIIEQVSFRSKSLDVVGIAKIVTASFLYKKRDKIAKIVRRETVHYFVKDNKFVFFVSIL